MAEAAESKPVPPRPRKRRWLRRAVGGMAAICLLVTIAGGLTWHHRVRLINRWLDAADWPVRVSVREVDLTRGLIHVRHVEVRGRDGSALGRVDEIRARALPGSIRSRTLESLVIDGLEGELAAEAWKAMAAEEKPAGAASAPTAWTVKRASVTARRFRWDDGAGMSGEVQGKVTTGEFGVAADGTFRLQKGALELASGTFADGDGRRLQLGPTTLAVAVDGAARTVAVDAWKVTSADVRWVFHKTGNETEPQESAVSRPWAVSVGSTDLSAVAFDVQTADGARMRGVGALRGTDFAWTSGGVSCAPLALELRDATWEADGDRVSVPRLALSAKRAAGGPWEVETGNFDGAQLAFQPREGVARRPGVSAHVDGAVAALRVGDEGTVESAARQTARLADVRVWFAGQEPCFTAEEAAVDVVPDDLREKKAIAALTVRRGALDVHGGLFPQAQGAPDGAEQVEKEATSPAAWNEWSVEALDVADMTVKAHDLGAGQPSITTKLALLRRAGEAAYTATLSDVVARGADLAQPPIAEVRQIVAQAAPASLRDRVIDVLEVTGAGIEIGAGLRSLQGEGNARADAGPAAISPSPAEPAPAWKIGRAAVAESRVRLVGLLEKLEPVEFGLGLELKDFPLSEEGLRQRAETQRVELSKIRVNSVFGGSGVLPVATMNTVFLEFSPAGLLDRRLERVEVLSPVIYVGDPLFWYVEHVRKLAAGEGDAPGPGAADAAEAVTPAEKPWSIGTVDAHFGQLRFAFKGSELDALPPLPFSCSTRLDEGKVDLVLDVPRETWRPSTRMPLEIDVEEGTSVFNLPLATRDNNLVQLFRASEVRYDQFKVRNVFLSTTYDKNGAYAQFGGELYGGYVRGGFDLYADDNMSWDFWFASDGKVDVAPVTAALTPEYLRMTGRAKFEMKAYGDVVTGSLYNATGHFSTEGGGEMTITGLDPLKEKMPELWSQLQRSLTVAGISALRDFPFDTCTGDFQLYGREGDLKLKIDGPRGVRLIEVRSHDHDATVAK